LSATITPTLQPAGMSMPASERSVCAISARRNVQIQMSISVAFGMTLSFCIAK
jgi:hypothetical protein